MTLRNYTEEELEIINANARKVAQWGSGKRVWERRMEWVKTHCIAIILAIGISACVSVAVSSWIKALSCLR